MSLGVPLAFGIAIAHVFVQKRAARSVPRSCMFAAPTTHLWSVHVSLSTSSGDGSVEECIDLLDELVKDLPHAPTSLAVALRVHLEALLRALLSGDLCTREEVRAFLRELEREVLEHEDGSDA